MALDRDTAVRMLVSGRSSLLGYIYSIVRDWGLADDVFQEVSILLLRKSESIRGPGQFGARVRSAARLEAMNLLRKRNRGPLSLDNALLDVLDGAWDDAESAVPGDRLESLHDCVRELTERARHLLRLRYSEGIKGEALAAALGQDPNTVYVSLSRIHKRLALCIERRTEERRRLDESGPSGPSPFTREESP